MPPYIELKGVTFVAGDGRIVFDHADLRLSAGEKVLITGPVASGKSLLVRLVTAQIEPDAGAVELFGAELRGLKPRERNELKKRIGFITQDSVLISNLKVVENVALPLLYHSGLSHEGAMEKAFSLLERSGFSGDPWALPGPLPLYLKREIVAARALALEPDAVVCENPWDGLTEAEKAALSAFLLEYHSTGNKLLLLTAHNDGDARLIKPDRIIRIEGNRFSQ
jgi:phospholipid/cholesterol/gamma-HCH transport system ATP-binding protein